MSTIRMSRTWTGRFELLLITDSAERERSRQALKDAGFGSPLPGVWIAPSGVPVPAEAKGAIRCEVSAEDDSGRRLLRDSWPLDRTADAYQKFIRTFEPLRGWIDRGEPLTESDAFTARILLIHHYRRVVLHDPLLPAALAAEGLAGRGGPAIVRRNLSRAARAVGTVAGPARLQRRGAAAGRRRGAAAQVPRLA